MAESLPPPTPLTALHPRREPAPRRLVRHLKDRSARAGILSRPLFGSLPLRRWVPSEVHSLLDYRGGVIAAVAGQLSANPVARRTGWVLGALSVGVTLLTDSRLSAAKLIPIEAHELWDYTFGKAAVLAPFALGYARTNPVVAAVHVLVGLSAIGMALVTDYRCVTGMHLGGELATDPEGIGA
ncbi:hypothetical protein LZ198_18965 [Myxococcus sp. K15C18031901]|uniref:hypothetical protein n=1 Tax=Myxococcus dinghuensis TaxID=2906761 RepID=UPI0020A75E8C|nr:hypothetical protein [Myxococcus dinghuensis]MCP3100958.1 hypothetical protein [Myxococcus dinghuensis]